MKVEAEDKGGEQWHYKPGQRVKLTQSRGQLSSGEGSCHTDSSTSSSCSSGPFVGEESVLNSTNTLFPLENVFVINEWWKTTGESVWERQPKNAPSSIVPDVLTYHFKGNDENELFGCKKLKRL